MTGKRILIVGLGLIWLAVLTAIVITSVEGLDVPPWGNPVGNSISAEVAQDTEVGQLFVAPMSGLCAIELVLDEGTSTTSQEVHFHLRPYLGADHDLWSSTFSTANVDGGKPMRFDFEPIAGPAGDDFYFYLDSPASQPGDAIAIRYGVDAELPGATAYQAGVPLTGNLQFHTYYCLSTQDKIHLLLSRLAEGRPYWFGTTAFYVLLAVVYVGLLGLFLLLTARTILEEWENSR